MTSLFNALILIIALVFIFIFSHVYLFLFKSKIKKSMSLNGKVQEAAVCFISCSPSDSEFFCIEPFHFRNGFHSLILGNHPSGRPYFSVPSWQSWLFRQIFAFGISTAKESPFFHKFSYHFNLILPKGWQITTQVELYYFFFQLGTCVQHTYLGPFVDAISFKHDHKRQLARVSAFRQFLWWRSNVQTARGPCCQTEF